MDAEVAAVTNRDRDSTATAILATVAELKSAKERAVAGAARTQLSEYAKDQYVITALSMECESQAKRLEGIVLEWLVPKTPRPRRSRGRR